MFVHQQYLNNQGELITETHSIEANSPIPSVTPLRMIESQHQVLTNTYLLSKSHWN